LPSVKSLKLYKPFQVVIVSKDPNRMRYAFEVVPLITERAYDYEHLLIIGLVVLFSIDKLSRPECN
jgi:hypothetical protein